MAKKTKSLESEFITMPNSKKDRQKITDKEYARLESENPELAEQTRAKFRNAASDNYRHYQ